MDRFSGRSFFRRSRPAAFAFSDILLVLLPHALMASFFYGVRALFVLGIAVTTALVTEALGCFLMKKEIPKGDWSPVVTGLILGLMLPAGVPYWVPSAGSAFAILVAKLPFGGTGRNIFNPACAGWAFLALSAPGEMFRFPHPALFGSVSPSYAPGFSPGVSPASMLKLRSLPGDNPIDLLLGSACGPMGTTCIVVLCAAFFVLVLRKPRLLAVTLPFLGAVVLFASVFPRVPSGIGDSVFYELFSGSLLFCAMFAATDTVTSPRTLPGKILFGIGCGLFTMLFRRYGAYEEGACFAILLMNAASPRLDELIRRLSARFGPYTEGGYTA